MPKAKKPKVDRAYARNDWGEPFSKWKPSDKFACILDENALPGAIVTLEYQFTQARGWRFDYAWVDAKVAVEIDGFGFGHQAQQRIAQNNEKRNVAVELGWRVLVFDSKALGGLQGVRDAVTQTYRVICEATPIDDTHPAPRKD